MVGLPPSTAHPSIPILQRLCQQGPWLLLSSGVGRAEPSGTHSPAGRAGAGSCRAWRQARLPASLPTEPLWSPGSIGAGRPFSAVWPGTLISPCVSHLCSKKPSQSALDRDGDANGGTSAAACRQVKSHWLTSAGSRQEGRHGHTASEKGHLPGSVSANAGGD